MVNLVTSKGRESYSGFISEFACFKCKSFAASSSEKDINELTAKGTDPERTAKLKQLNNSSSGDIIWNNSTNTTAVCFSKESALNGDGWFGAAPITNKTVSHHNSIIETKLTAVANERPPSPPHNAFKRWRKSASIKVNESRNLINRNNNRKSKKKILNQQQIHNNDIVEDMPFLKYLAINALDLSAPASDVLLKSRRSNWFQLSGHPDSLAPAGPGTVWKKRAADADDTERVVYEQLSVHKPPLEFIPKYYREVEYNGDKFIELQDLLHGFNDPYVIDIKMGRRTFLESEVKNVTERMDLYQKMIAIDPMAPTPEENLKKSITKLRYMQFREQQSSSCNHGFRIEAMKCGGKPPIHDLKKIKSQQEIINTLKIFLNGNNESAAKQILNQLKNIRSQIEASDFFKVREVVGSSLFIIYDDEKVGVWLIDFAKTNLLPEGVFVDHRKPWVPGNYEEGLLFGFDNLITIFEENFATPTLSTTKD